MPTKLKKLTLTSTCDAGNFKTIVTDENGEKVKNIRSVTFRHEAGSVPIIELEIVAFSGELVLATGDARFAEYSYVDHLWHRLWRWLRPKWAAR